MSGIAPMVKVSRAPQQRPAFTSRQFRDALGHAPSGVAIVTTLTESGQKLGMTVSSFTSVSLDPPLVLFSIARSANSFPEWERAKHCAINVLSERQGEISTRFARALSDKWDGVLHRPSATGMPVLAGTVAWFGCQMHAQCDGGDHLIIIGRVTEWGIEPSRPRPLLFHRGRYRKLDPDAEGSRPPEDSELFGW